MLNKSLVFFCLLFSWQVNAADIKTFSEERFVIENKAIDESSGLAYSTQQQNIIWTHNDSGNLAVIYALEPQGKDVASFTLDKVKAFDWEDMASFRENNKSYLLVADTGDNFKFRNIYRLIILLEPQVNIEKTSHQNPPVARQIIFSYPKEKSYDVEAVSVDSVNNKILLMSKSKKTVKLFELPLHSQQPSSFEAPIVAQKLGEIESIKKATSLDISKDGTMAAVLIYGYVYLFQKDINQQWIDAFQQKPQVIKYKRLYQPEAICFGKNNHELFISSEKRSTLVKIFLKR